MPMLAAEKRKVEMENLKNERRRHIIECSFGLFAEKGIENISMNEIASQAEIGVASLYRYFQTKEDLAIEVAVYAWKLESQIFENEFSSNDFGLLSGFEQLRNLLEVFQSAVVSQRSFFRFVYYFDSFITKAGISPEKLKPYEDTVNSTNMLVINAFQKGKSDGSIRFSDSNNFVISESTDIEMCFTIMHSIFCVAQKLAISGEILNLDRAVDGRRQIEILINVLLHAIRA
ncbi:TetR/AcrR family transcriptional regulator [Treponema zioleckii]|uniref:TetR/AcrR family transcriptional regulator n=1 Tax=Treponema zioleckii TaxID=331680 RepID=UPI00168A6036|nr:TetR/AcrR family transcriptional regulator [Treponema zioleckii]